jgi:GNAT superfamily N-acetyltransferase
MLERSYGNYVISWDPARIDLDAVEGLLRTTFWANERPRSVIEKSLENSITFGAFLGEQQVALARVVTDYATFGWVCDVVVEDAHRGNGLSKAMMEAIMSHPELGCMRRFILATNDAHSLYERYGFKRLDGDTRWMERYID